MIRAGAVMRAIPACRSMTSFAGRWIGGGTRCARLDASSRIAAAAAAAPGRSQDGPDVGAAGSEAAAEVTGGGGVAPTGIDRSNRSIALEMYRSELGS